MTTIEINVTQQNINNGKPGDACMCPVALAMADAGLFFPFVGETLAGWSSSSLPSWCYRIVGCLPPEAVNFINEFDKLSSASPLIKPFRFTIEVVPPLREAFPIIYSA